MHRAHHEKCQAGCVIGWSFFAKRNNNNFRYVDDTTPMSESEEELKNFLRRVKKKSEEAALKLNIIKTLRSWHLGPSLHGK